MSRRYRLTPEAQANVDKIGAFIAKDSVDAALRVLDAFEDAFSLLAATPEIGHKREDLTNPTGQVLERLLVSNRVRPREHTSHDPRSLARRTRR